VEERKWSQIVRFKSGLVDEKVPRYEACAPRYRALKGLRQNISEILRPRARCRMSGNQKRT
jgi:hypothetical protein